MRVLVRAALLAWPLLVQAQEKFPATLAGHAWLGAQAISLAPPKDAPELFAISGRFTGPLGKRMDELGSVPGGSFISSGATRRLTGFATPVKGQPLQGFSGIKSMGDGTYWVTTDNGYGNKRNSPDALLMFHRIKPDWKSGAVEVQETVFLRDPDRKVPYLIVNENTKERYLTGADIDPESIQPVGDTFWFGDEFGPFLVQVDRQGKVLAMYEAKVDGKPIRSPDHHGVGAPAGSGAFNVAVRRSRGFEGLAASRDGKFLFALLEGALWSEADKKNEAGADGREYLRILEFDVARADWSGRGWKYRLEANGHSIGDFNLVDAGSGLIVERDNLEGTADDLCAGAPRADCYPAVTQFKRVYKVSLADASAEGFVKKVGYIDLLDIADPKAVARRGAKDGVFRFPFVTIENVDVVDADHIIVANDNNFPFSAGRKPNVQDDNELILLRVPELLRAR
jgi:hypothetical protein